MIYPLEPMAREKVYCMHVPVASGPVIVEVESSGYCVV
jgi:hypothetical protein